jgi:hypothetical protein
MRRVWPFFVGSLLLTPALIWVALLSAGGGHGDYVWAKVFFPFTILSTNIFRVVTPVFLGVGLVQTPLYGLILGVFAKSGRLLLASCWLLLVHISAVVACFVLPLKFLS